MSIVRILEKPLMFLAVLVPIPSLYGQTLERLHDGETFTIHGRLEARYRGWQRHVVVKLNHRYLADFGKSEGTKEVSELEVNSTDGRLALADHIGEKVEARGKLQLEAVSPYYWNGVMLMVTEVKSDDESTIQSTASMNVHPMPATISSYIVTIFMKPQQMQWPHDAVDLKTGKPLLSVGTGSCALNGGGDVMNCYCGDGFMPVRAGVVKHAHAATDWQAIPEADLPLPGMAQMVLDDPDAHRPETIQVVCQRK